MQASRPEVFPSCVDMSYDQGLAVIKLNRLRTVEASDEVTADLCSCTLQAAFRREVSETSLRCMDLGYDQDLAVLEVNRLKTVKAFDEVTADSCACTMQAAFRREVSETFLRCVDMGYDQDLAVIELNGLKIAEARDFADNASYIMTTILSLCLPAAPRVREEYRSRFPESSPDSKTPVSSPLHMVRFCCRILSSALIALKGHPNQSSECTYQLPII